MKITKKIESLLAWIAEGDDGLTKELKEEGAAKIAKDLLCLLVAIFVILTLWVAL